MHSSSVTTRKSDVLWQSVVILPAQFTESSYLRSPEAWLMSAVFEDAFQCLVGNIGKRDRRSRREFREAYDWFSSERQDWPFAFLCVCGVLGLDIDAVRQRVEEFASADQAVAEAIVSVATTDARMPAASGSSRLREQSATQSVDRRTGRGHTNSVARIRTRFGEVIRYRRSAQ